MTTRSEGSYKGPKIRAYSSLSAQEKAAEDRQNETDMKMRKLNSDKGMAKQMETKHREKAKTSK